MRSMLLPVCRKGECQSICLCERIYLDIVPPCQSVSNISVYQYQLPQTYSPIDLKLLYLSEVDWLIGMKLNEWNTVCYNIINILLILILINIINR